MSDSPTLVLSSRNPGKLRELRELVQPLGLAVSSAAEVGAAEVAEDGATFIDNALLKAVAAWRATAGRALCLADDSGLVVDGLGGAPGVRSARYAGEDATDADNCRALVEALEGVPDAGRRAAFVCHVVLLLPEAASPAAPGDGDGWRRLDRALHPEVPHGAAAFVAEGRVEGLIVDEPAGHGGFGYDPHFFYEPAGVTFAELDSAAKHAISHRGQAMGAIARCLAAAVRAMGGG